MSNREAKQQIQNIVDELIKGMSNEDAIAAINDLESMLEIRRMGLEDEEEE